MRRITRLKMIKRDKWLVNECRGKRVLHIGCTDHPITAHKIAQNKLLHTQLVRVAAEVIGLDIDKEGIDTLSSLMPEQQFILHSAEESDQCTSLSEQRFDIIVATDVIEHISNIGLFLGAVCNKSQPGGKLLITTPQAFAIKRMLIMMLTGYEYVHPDHIAYFSVSTLSRMLSRYQMEIDQVHMFQWSNSTFRNWLGNMLVLPLLWLSNGRLCDEVAIVAVVQSSSSP